MLEIYLLKLEKKKSGSILLKLEKLSGLLLE